MQLPRRVVLSRKGFDGGTGFVPSPIFSDATMLSLPIPDRAGTVSYDDLFWGGHSFGKMVTDLKAKHLTREKVKMPLTAQDRAHLDPDLIHGLLNRKSGWCPAYGQCGKDATILRQQQVDKGDLFLFFGWFRQCELVGGTYRYLAGAPDIHVIFGYLRVGEVLKLKFDPVPEWAIDHPHLHGNARKADTGNTLFVAANTLGLPNSDGLPGAGAFTRFSQQLQLTAPGKTRSWWRLPKWFYPPPGTSSLSSHEKRNRWSEEKNSCLLQSVARGQEFVMDAERFPEVTNWATDLIRNGLNASLK
jgi:hypothetical protein